MTTQDTKDSQASAQAAPTPQGAVELDETALERTQGGNGSGTFHAKLLTSNDAAFVATGKTRDNRKA